MFQQAAQLELTVTGDLDLVAELTDLSVNLNAATEVVLERRSVKDTVASGTGVVDEELVLHASGGLLGGLRRIIHVGCQPTEKKSQQSKSCREP